MDGARAYDLARDGETVELAARPLRVESLRLVSRPDADHAEFEMICGKGGYVRSIARDLGAALGCGGHVSALRRTWSGPFELSDAVSLDELEAMRDDPDAPARLLPVAAGLHDLDEVPESVRDALEIILVDEMHEVLEHALEPRASHPAQAGTSRRLDDEDSRGANVNPAA